MGLRNKVLRSGIAAMMLLALPFAASAQDATEDEVTEPVYQLSILEDGEVFEDAFELGVTAHLYGFYGAADDVVTISMTQAEGADLDPYLVLLGPYGQMVMKDDDSGDSMAALISEAVLPMDGVYFIIASTFNDINGIIGSEPSDVAMNYSITVQGLTINEEDGTDLEFFYSPLVSGESLVGYSNVDEPVYYFTYVGEAGATLDVSLSSSDFDTLLMVFAPGGDRIAVNDDSEEADSVGTDSEVKGIILAETGKYLIFATDVAFPNAGDEEATLAYKGGDFEILLSAGE